MSSKSNTPYIGGDPLPRPDISDRGERGTPINKPKAKVHAHKKAAARKPASKPAQTAKADPAPPAKKSSYRAPDNYSTYGRPGTNDMGPSSKPKTISLGKLPSGTVGDIPSTGKSDFASRFPTATAKKGGNIPSGNVQGVHQETGIVPIPPEDNLSPKQDKHAYKVNWS